MWARRLCTTNIPCLFVCVLGIGTACPKGGGGRAVSGGSDSSINATNKLVYFTSREVEHAGGHHCVAKEEGTRRKRNIGGRLVFQRRRYIFLEVEGGFCGESEWWLVGRTASFLFLAGVAFCGESQWIPRFLFLPFGCAGLKRRALFFVFCFLFFWGGGAGGEDV